MHPKAFPSDRRERFRGRWAAACGGSDEVDPPRQHWFARILPGERPHPSFSKNASVFTEIHLPLNRQLRCLGKAVGYRLSPGKSEVTFPLSRA